MEVIDRLNICYFIEKTAEQLYRTMADKFPEGSDLFLRLSREEEHHANIITICMGYYKAEPLSGSVPPPSAMDMSETLVLEISLREMLKSGELDIKTAVEKAVEMEGTIAEEYFNLLRQNTTDKDITAYIRECYKDEECHGDQLKAFLAQLNG